MERNSGNLTVTVGIVAAIGVSLLATVAVLNRRDQTVGLNQEIQYDDFAFSALAVRKESVLGDRDSQTRAKGVFCIVAIKVANHAVRVDYTFKKTCALLVDDRGREFRLSSNGQQALESSQGQQCAGAIAAGASCVTEVVFDVPADARLSQLRISDGGLVGDILDVIFWGKKRIDLGSLQ